MRRKNFLFFGLWAAIIVMIGSCYPNRAEFVDELDIAATNFDEDFDFSSVMTYYMPDSIVRITDEDDPDPPSLDPEEDAQILAAIATNFQNVGYTRLDEASQEQADVVILVSAVTTETLVLWWDYWGWWPGWGYYPPGYGPGWGWWYPWGGVSGYSYTTGSLIIQMVDPNDPDEAEDEVPVAWLGVVNGLAQGSNENIIFRANRGVDQLFAQSPYLDVN